MNPIVAIKKRLHRDIAEQSMRARTEIIQRNRSLRKLFSAVASLTRVFRPAQIRCAQIDLSQSDISGRVVRIERDRALE